MVNKQARRRRARGRPPKGASDDVRQALFAAARTLFLRYGYRAVSSRQIAAAAGANTAMIRYYFGGKAGLYREMLEGVLQGLRARIDALQASSEPADVSEIVEGAQRLWARNPWIAGFVLREVLTPEAPLRSMFLREIGGRIYPLVERVVTREIEAGRLDAHLDPKLVVLSMVSLAVFPFLAFQITSRVFGVQLDDAYVERLGRHTRALLASGFKSPEDRA
jgi:TetR/AcrR family transcriptional regulator